MFFYFIFCLLFSPLALSGDLDRSRDYSLSQEDGGVCIVPQKRPFEVQELLQDQVLEAKRSLEKQSEKAWITPCCRSVKVGLTPKDTRESKTGKTTHNYVVKKFDVHYDPYSSGPKKNPSFVSWGFGYTDPRYFRFNREGLNEIGIPIEIKERIPYRIPVQRAHESETDYYLRRLKDELKYLGIRGDLNRVLTLAGNGSQSIAFWYHDPMPSDRELALMYPLVDDLMKGRSNLTPMKARRQAWASSNAKQVIKLRTLENWKDNPQDTARQTKRDLVLGEIFESLANRFKIVPSGRSDGTAEPLIRVLKYHSTRDELSRGISRQEPARGESVYYIAGRIHRAMQGDENEVRYLIDELKFSSLEDAKMKINVLENFYRTVHNEVYNFQVSNDLIGPAGYTHSGNVVSIGFDYNLGRNVVWDSKLKKFIVFDY